MFVCLFVWPFFELPLNGVSQTFDPQVDVDRAEEATQMLTSEEGASKAPFFE